MKKHPSPLLCDVMRVSVLLLAVICSAGAGRKISVPHDFPSIHAALGECDAGDTIFVAKGVYHENIALADNIVLLGEDMLLTVIDGGRKGPCVVGADGAVIRNFTIQNGTVGILCRNTRPTIDRNLIIDNKGAGIHALLTLPDITDNIIYRNRWTGIFLESVRSTRSSVDHNVIAENGYSGIFCGGRSEALISNNIITANKEYGIFVGTNSHKTRITSNNLYDNREQFNGDAVIQPSNIQKPPNFMDPGYPSFNYFVRPVSACKARGENGTDIGLITEQAVTARINDRDGDGIPDEVDQCPDVPEDKDGFEDEDGCPDYDNDRDGIPDSLDQCPNLPSVGSGIKDQNGCPNYDRDADGIPDSLDQCPNQPENYNGYKDDDGCPDTLIIEINTPLVLEGVNFKTASAELETGSGAALDKVVASLKAYPNLKVEIAGHTDEEGSDSYNMALSNDRAKAVMDYLVAHGIASDRISARGYGKTQPLVPSTTPEGRAKNRRVEVLPVK
jgi:outer membrane protein OmpA-like peptidoglycan-associated protein